MTTQEEKKESTAPTTKVHKTLQPPNKSLDFASLPWNLNHPEKHNFILLKTKSEWNETHLNSVSSSVIYPYSTTSLDFHPATTSLNYGTTIWEGLKCFRTQRNRAAVFRPEMNWKRFCNGCEAMCLPAPSYDLFMKCIQTVVQTNAELIPPLEEGVKLYIRPIIFGSGEQLGLYPSQEFTLCFYVSPTGNYFKNKVAGGLNLHLETKYCRAARGGTGNVKCSGNYAVALRPLMSAKKQGFDDNLYIELETYNHSKQGTLQNAVIQELSAANVFLVLNDGSIITPSLHRGTILPGVTRDSVIQIVTEYANDDLIRSAMIKSTGDDNVQVKVVERDVLVADFLNATEAFVTGTAAEIVPIQSLKTGQGEEDFSVTLKYGHVMPGGPVTEIILKILREIMTEARSCDRTKTWLPDPFAKEDDFKLG